MALLLQLASASAVADPATAAPSDESSTTNVSALPTVVVTARYKQEREIDTPVSMVVLDGDALADSHMNTAHDLPEKVAGLTVYVPNPRLTTLGIRGLSSNSFNDGLESSVGLFVDGVYMGKQGFSIFDLVDIDRIEVLRGPQGTLFGKNTTAGAMLIHTRLPTQAFESTLEGSLGDYHSRQLRGTVSGALVQDDLAGRLTGYLTQRDGLITNLYNNQKLNNQDRGGLRGQLLWTPATDLRGRFILEYGHIDERCCAYPLVAPERAAIKASDGYMEYQRASLNPYDRVTDSDGKTNINLRQLGTSAEFVWMLDENLSLTSITAARDWKFFPFNDDATSLRLVEGGTENRQRQYTQELRLSSRGDDVDLTVGTFLMHQVNTGRERGLLRDQLSDWVFGGLIREQVPGATISNTGAALHLLVPPQTLDGMIVLTPYTQQLNSAAGFASADWHLTSQWELTTGLRYTFEHKSAVVSRSRSGGDPSASPLSLTDNLTPLGALIGQDLSGYTFGGLLDSVAGGAYFREDQRSEGNFSGQLALSYKFDPEHMVYASIARGYKSGGINLGVTGQTVKPTFKPEIANAYEIGTKHTFFGRRLSLSADVYHTDIQDYQAFTFDDDKTLIPNPRMNNLLNVGAVKLDGVELEANGMLYYGLRGHLGVAYNRAITTDFKNAPDANNRKNTKDLSGQSLYNAPLWSSNAALEQAVPLTDRLAAAVAVEYSYRTGTYGTVEHGESSYINGYGLANARATLADIQSGWMLSLWVRNLFDAQYVSAVQPLYGVGDYGAFAGDPRTIGMTARLELR